MNFAVWRNDERVTGRYESSFLDGIAAELQRLSASDDAGVVTFALRQLAIEKTEA